MKNKEKTLRRMYRVSNWLREKISSEEFLKFLEDEGLKLRELD